MQVVLESLKLPLVNIHNNFGFTETTIWGILREDLVLKVHKTEITKSFNSLDHSKFNHYMNNLMVELFHEMVI